ncbi:MAG TPA: hypothetical protein PL044_08515 [Clostridiales bacterium]|nr:MAG: Transposase IS200 like protein [Firmicutes bacterium ADurb.Bin262]HOU10665.1 hypothetical protein [Clostridiales bacterium]HQH63774.1 hypothetical protein [Clostridiales bacterium]HQK73795.1 hypothetical protein [Clostridiales bacterium]
MDLPQRKPQRLKGYDYSQNNAYFITICTQNRLPILGSIKNDIVALSEFGKVVEEKLLNIGNGTDVFIDKYVFMPNHIHLILIIERFVTVYCTGTTRGSFPTSAETIRSDGTTRGAFSTMPETFRDDGMIPLPSPGFDAGYFPSVSEMVQRFKTATTSSYIHGVKSGIYPPFEKKIWQKSFYDHVIRNEKGYLEVWRYIDENPLKWRDDELLKNIGDVF